MHRRVRQYVMSIWVAMLGILFGAMAPAMSHAMSPSGNRIGHVQLCSMEGVKTVAMDMAAPQLPGKAMADYLLEHCPCCTTQDSPASLPPPAGFLVDVLSQRLSHPLLFYQAPRPLFAWTAAHPRAPPCPV